MINIQKCIRLQSFNVKKLRKVCFSICNNCESNCSVLFNSSNHSKARYQVCQENISSALFSTSTASSSSEELLDFNLFDKVSEETLESLTEFFEELMERKEKFGTADISYSGGVLTVNLGKYGTYVINRQTPNRQIWLSSPVSGPKRYDYVISGSYWIYKHDMVSLHELLQGEISKILGETVDFSECLHAKVQI